MFKKITIIGVGLLGGSFALAMRKYGLAEKIVGVSSSIESAKNAQRLGVIDEASDSISESVANADLVLIATPMLTMENVLHQVALSVSADCLITDVGSVKKVLVDLIDEKFSQLKSQFIFAHPIAGGERSGADAARDDLFQGKHLILADGDKADSMKMQQSKLLWKTLGAIVVEMSAKDHDKVFAYTSHLPHVIAYTLVNNLHHQSNSKQLFDFASAGFYDFTRIASSSPVMWRDICLSNKDEVLSSMKQFSKQLDILVDVIEKGDAEKLKEIFNDAKKARDEGLIKKHH
jgi:prephenate dehydrogenase